MSTPRKTLVFGPAYLDRVVRVDRPLIDPAVGGVLDQSTMGRWLRSDDSRRIEISGLPTGGLTIDLPSDWPGPAGRIQAGTECVDNSTRNVICASWQDDLGGMGSGYAKALGGRLCLLLGDDTDPINTRVTQRLEAEGIEYQPIVMPGRLGEWTLMITSGEYGDKLPIGFRDPGAAPTSFAPFNEEPCDLLVAASMTNSGASSALAGTNARVRMFAPAMRNMIDAAPRVSRFAKHIDILCCNRTEWESLDDREEVAWRVSLLVVTDGPRGADIRYTTANGDAGRLEVPVFPRQRPPRDTNRAGEAFASTLVATLLDDGWEPGTTDDDLLVYASLRASAAAALVLDRVDFGFPTKAEIDRAIKDRVICE